VKYDILGPKTLRKLKKEKESEQNWGRNWNLKVVIVMIKWLDNDAVGGALPEVYSRSLGSESVLR